MSAFRAELSNERAVELEKRLRELVRPGVVFSEPLRQGDHTLITATRYTLRQRMFTARPVAAIIISPDGIKVHPISNLLNILGVLIPLSAIIIWGSMLILHPPWRPGFNMFNEVRELLKTIKGE